MLQRNVYLTHGNNYNNHIAVAKIYLMTTEATNEKQNNYIFEEVKYLGHMGEVIDPLLNT